MTSSVDLHEVGEVDSCVDLGRGERTVAEELLNGPQIHTGLEQVGRERVTQGMGVEVGEIGGATDGGVEKPAY